MSQTIAAGWTLKLFGKPQVTGNGVCLEQFDTKRAVYLLARLALAQRKALARNEAAEFLWPDDFFDATRLRLRQELARLRRGLGPARDIIQTDEEWVRLVDQDLEVDVRTFELLFRQMLQETDPARRETLSLKALEVSAELFLAGYDESWIDAERSRFAEVHYRLLTDLSTLQSQRGDNEAALESARRAVDLNPLKEAAHLLVIQELGNLGHVSDALGQFQQMKRVLREGLSEAPSAEAQKVVEALSATPVTAPLPRSVSSGLTLEVPAPSEPIYGREEIIAHLCRTLDPSQATHRLVSLTGPGGIGKTRLSTQVAVELREAYGNRIGWISFADISDPANIPLALATQLGVSLAPNADPLERVTSLLPREPTLLVLDNLEQLVPDGVGYLKTLAESRPNLRLLMTSRVALNLGGERVVRVGPLPIPNNEDTLDQPAMRIFLDPLFAEEGFHEPSESDWAILRQIAEKLEGIPLALQLASGRLRNVTPTDLLGQLDKRLDIPNKRVDAPERHRTIRASIAGSFQALDPNLQRVMGRLSVFRGGWNQSAAAYVCELDDPLPALERLLDYSLIRVDKEDRGLRFRMLETIRDYVREEIAADELFAAHSKHADWIIELGHPQARLAIDAESVEKLKILDPELDNIREAARFCLENDLPKAALLGVAFGRYWTARSLIREALKFYEELFAHDLPVNEIVARASYEQATIHYIINALQPKDSGPSISDRTLKLCQETGLEIEQALCTMHQSRILHNKGDIEGSLLLIADAEKRLRDLNSPHQALALQARAQMYYYQGNTEEAIKVMEEAAAVLGTMQSPFHLIQSSMMLGFMYLEIGDIQKAKEHSFEGLALGELYGDSRFTPMIQEACGKIAQAEGDLDQAEQWFKVSISGWEFFGNVYQQADVINQLARLHILKNEPEQALPRLASAVRLWEGKGVMMVVPKSLISAARVFFQTGRPDFGARLLGAVKALNSKAGESNLASEMEFVADLEEDLKAELGSAELARIFSEAPDLETALREAFPD